MQRSIYAINLIAKSKEYDGNDNNEVLDIKNDIPLHVILFVLTS